MKREQLTVGDAFEMATTAYRQVRVFALTGDEKPFEVALDIMQIIQPGLWVVKEWLPLVVQRLREEEDIVMPSVRFK